jgi:asparagine synthase (glutamine-hydrolysing)
VAAATSPGSEARRTRDRETFDLRHSNFMTELCAVAGLDPAEVIQLEREARGPRRLKEIRAVYQKEAQLGTLYMAVTGDHSVDSFFFKCPEFSLICRADLLGLDSPARASTALRLGSLYRQHGDSFICGLSGTFAIIVYDNNTRTLKAWTDHFGVERLAFTKSNGCLAIATDVRMLLRFLRQHPPIDPTAIQQYLQYTCIPSPKTIYKGISKLEPGHELISRPITATRSYWDMKYESAISDRPEALWVKDTRKAVRSAVARTVTALDSTDKVGCFLSGGTDSSSVAGLVGQITSQPPRTFSIGFDDPRYNEIRYARIAAKRFCADHHEYFVQPADILALVQKAVTAYDEPYGNSSIIPTYFCARLAAENGITHLFMIAHFNNTAWSRAQFDVG